MQLLFNDYTLGTQKLNNRIVMAPMTRSRAIDGKPDSLTKLYYAQRASAGLIISEGLPISQQATGYLYTPGIYQRSQVTAWQPVTRAVHENGGKFFAQLWHVGRVSHTSLQANGQAPVSSVAVQGGKSFAYSENGEARNIPATKPTALDSDGIRQIINDFRRAAANAIAAGFDGVEIHAANGYLIEQFINPTLNTRDDQYGGSSYENRTRLLLEVIDAVVAEIGADKTGVRLSPFNKMQDIPFYSDIVETHLYIADALNQRNITYVHLVLDNDIFTSGLLAKFRQRWNNTLIVAGGLTDRQAEQLIADDLTDLTTFGTPFIANPDFVERLRNGWPLATAQRRSFYGGTVEGYTDYPTYRESASTETIDTNHLKIIKQEKS